MRSDGGGSPQWQRGRSARAMPAVRARAPSAAIPTAPVPEIHSHVAGTLSNQQTTLQRTDKVNGYGPASNPRSSTLASEWLHQSQEMLVICVVIRIFVNGLHDINTLIYIYLFFHP